MELILLSLFGVWLVVVVIRENIKLEKKRDTTWSIEHEGHLNKKNIIFQDDAYKKLYLEMKKVDEELKKNKQ
jgi:hypothetical protein